MYIYIYICIYICIHNHVYVYVYMYMEIDRWMDGRINVDRLQSFHYFVDNHSTLKVHFTLISNQKPFRLALFFVQ